MRTLDALRFALKALVTRRLRCALMLLAMGIGVASVVLLTGLGEGARLFVVGEFQSLGTNLLFVLPGRSETTGGAPPLTGETPRDLTIDDAMAIARHPSVRFVAPVSVGAVPISRRGREREATVIGSTRDLLEVRNLKMARGRFLPGGDPDRAAAVCVLGETIREELFGRTRAIGQQLRVGDRKFRVIGVLQSRDESIGLDLGETVVIPVASAQRLFNSSSLFRVLVEARRRDEIDRAKQAVLSTIKERHEGEDDVTVVTQDSVVGAFDQILRILTIVVAGTAAISLLVAGVLIMNVMLVAVSQRTTEIGTLKALGATRRSILALFLAEAASLASIGGVMGLVVAQAGIVALRSAYPLLPVGAPWWAIAAALGVSAFTGVVFGLLPALRATRLDPVQALSGGRGP